MNFTVGVPSYNQGYFVDSTIKSLLEQIELPDAIIISENFSNDCTASVLAKYFDHPIVKIIKPPHHLTMMENWNFLVTHIESEWFSLLSSDDLAHPNYVKDIKRAIERSPDAVLVKGGFTKIDEKGRLINSSKRIKSIPTSSNYPFNLIEQLLGPKVNFSAFAVKRNAFNIVGGFPPELLNSGDWGLWIKLAHLGSFVQTKSVISSYRIYSTLRKNTLKKDRMLLKDDLIIYLNIFQRHTDKGFLLRFLINNAFYIRISRTLLYFQKVYGTSCGTKEFYDVIRGFDISLKFKANSLTTIKMEKLYSALLILISYTGNFFTKFKLFK